MRYLVFLGVTFVLLLVLGVFTTILPIAPVVPDLSLLVILYVVFSRRGAIASHVLFALALGYLADVMGGVPRGLHSSILTLLVLLARLAARRFNVEHGLSQVLIALVASLAASALAGLLGMLLGGALVFPPLLQLLSQALATSVCAPLIFRLGWRLDASMGLAVRRLSVR